MNSEPPAEQNPSQGNSNPAPRGKRRHIPNLFAWTFLTLAALILITLLLPVFGPSCDRSPQTKSLASAKQIALALKLYAGDHDGKFPTAIGEPDGVVDASGTATTSNAAFACLFPTYCTAEKLFYTPKSAYCNRTAPDEICNSKATCLASGENEYAYVAGLNDTDDATLPLVVDGTDGMGHYVSDTAKRGGVWAGKKAIVIHVDDSGEVATLAGPSNARYVPLSQGDLTHNLLAPIYLNSHHARLLDPAVPPIIPGSNLPFR